MGVVSAHIRRLIERAPTKPGTYTFLDRKGVPLYIGKAKNIRQRLQGHVQAASDGAKQAWMMEQVHDVTWIITPTENDALFMENQLIKQHQPRCNVMLRDDKTYYPYLRVTLSHPFPKLLVVRKVIPGSPDLFIGPFRSSYLVKNVVELCHQLFQIRSCSDTFFKLTKRPCLEYQLGRCRAPCVGYESPAHYHAEVKNMVQFLLGKERQVLKQLQAQMDRLSKQEHYLEAKALRDRIRMLEAFLAERQTEFTGVTGHSDFMAVKDGRLGVLHVRYGVITRIHISDRAWEELSDVEVLASGLAHYGTQLVVPSRVFVPVRLAHSVRLADELSKQMGHRVRIQMPRTEYEQRLMAHLMSEIAAYSKEGKSHISETLAPSTHAQQLTDFLHLAHIPQRLECIDVSHFQGDQMIGVAVVFDVEGPVKSAYRTYRIRQGRVDDPAAIAEVCQRRYAKAMQAGELPDVVIVDGGKGQRNAALRVLEKLGLTDRILVVALAKNRNTQYGGEKLYFPASARPIWLRVNHPLYRYLCHLRDEAHRFSISQQRRRLQKKVSRFVGLENISGMGEKRIAMVKRLMLTLGPDGILSARLPPKGIPQRIWKQVQAWVIKMR